MLISIGSGFATDMCPAANALYGTTIWASRKASGRFSRPKAIAKDRRLPGVAGVRAPAYNPAIRCLAFRRRLDDRISVANTAVYPWLGLSEPVSGFSHLLGAVAFLWPAVLLLRRGRGDWRRIAVLSVFVLSALFLCSAAARSICCRWIVRRGRCSGGWTWREFSC